MISNKMQSLVANSSVIRAMFDEGKRLSKIYGEENVFDFSLGNPNVEPPEVIKESINKKNPEKNTNKTKIPIINEAYSFAKKKKKKRHSKIQKKLK